MKGVKRQCFIVLILSFFLLFVACSSGNTDVAQFIKDTKNRKSKSVEPLPDIKKVEPYKYLAQNLRSPFEPFVTSTAVKLPPTLMGQGPDLNRPRELLESYPLESLRMVGTIAKAGKLYALVKDQQGIVHRVQAGNYIGQNFGKIQKITESMIEIREWAMMPTGTSEERTVIIPLSS